jgi:hypothetical protein
MARPDPKKKVKGKGLEKDDGGRGSDAPVPPHDDPAPTDPGFTAPRWVSSEESISFPNESSNGTEDGDEMATSRSRGRIALPSSGLASDILARQDTVAVEPTLPAIPEPAPAPPSPVTSRTQSSALFGSSQRDDRKAAPELMEHLVTFYLADEEYGLDVRTVQEIIRVTDTTHVPRAPQFIKGVINLRGRIIPVVDLKKKLELGEVAPSRLPSRPWTRRPKRSWT